MFVFIILVNSLFFIIWIYKIKDSALYEVRKKFPRLYVILCMAGKKKQFEKSLEQSEVLERNKELREDFMNVLKGVERLYDSK